MTIPSHYPETLNEDDAADNASPVSARTKRAPDAETPEKPVVRRAPPSREKSSVPIVERKGQSFEAARVFRERSRATFGTDNLADWELFLARAEAHVPLSQVELAAYAQMQLALADYALKVLSGRVTPGEKKDLPKPEDLYRAASAESLDAVRRRILEGIRFHRKRTQKRAKKLPEGDAAREHLEKMLDSRAANELLHTGSIPWDAAEDGHFLGRSTAWRLGIVRWARQIAPERAERISDALCRSEVHHAGTIDGRLCWEDGRPMLFVSEWTLLTVKLVHEAWLHDPRIVVVNTGKPLGRNPFAPFRLAFLDDLHGHVSALFGVTHTPVLVEPRFASVTYSRSLERPRKDVDHRALALFGASSRQRPHDLRGDHPGRDDGAPSRARSGLEGGLAQKPRGLDRDPRKGARLSRDGRNPSPPRQGPLGAASRCGLRRGPGRGAVRRSRNARRSKAPFGPVVRKLAGLFLALAAGTAAAEPHCPGRFPNPVTDVCWSCVFPIVVGTNVPLGKVPEDSYTPETDASALCVCGENVNVQGGVNLSFWEPLRTAEVVRHAWCSPTLGGVTLADNQGITRSPDHGRGQNGRNTRFANVHWFVSPWLFVLEAVSDISCLEQAP